MKCCVYTRIFYETPYINYFIEHYLKLGFDHIIFLQTDNLNYFIKNKFKKFITIIKTYNYADKTLNKYINNTKKFDWTLMIDNDEFLILHKKFKNIKDYIRKKLEINSRINIFYFRWLMVEKVDNINKFNSLKNILLNYNTYQNRFIKTMFKNKNFRRILGSHFVKTDKDCIYFENNILDKNYPIQEYTEHIYNDHFLLHLHTRSLNNLIIKSLKTKFFNKKCKNIFNLRNYIFNYSGNINKEIFLDIIGLKSKLPYAHSQENKIKYEKLKNFKIFDYNLNFIDKRKEINLLKKVLKELNFNEKKFIELISDYEKLIVEEKRFSR